MTSIVSNLLASDKETLILRSWKPTVPVVATVTFIHGIGEHSGRYEHVFSKFAENGILVNAFDQRGHGKSGGTRGHSPSLEQSLKDITLIASNADPALPHFIYGHSFGGCLALHYTLKNQERAPAGCVVTSPLIKPAFKVSGFKLFLGNLLGKVAATSTIDSNLNASHISKDAEVVATYKKDVLVHSKISLGLGRWMLSKAESLLDEAPKYTSPVLLIHGNDDKITCPKASQQFFDRIASTDKTLKLWEDMYHEVHNEKDQDLVIQFIIDWIILRVAGPVNNQVIVVPTVTVETGAEPAAATSTTTTSVVVSVEETKPAEASEVVVVVPVVSVETTTKAPAAATEQKEEKAPAAAAPAKQEQQQQQPKKKNNKKGKKKN
ncbi:hypothetical protein SAMD00019534_072510 [Acytostelium subglobosum LB1]|uniref:hypothetical protein n=1 Tax=Acytostelium subglobosum LB1 TaxID=1410327 RepID=UPI00064500CD|nr:hypothetical protein SAMD00019534_072510 [Acytostelium subglobosum LB1]GAM24077.1 hypothetical protein SAMD00019534_072510 [Acytostelium subglobosum LB1]|eukprot:XP_012753113.1 hypothetical protein SAMD00019534_072510 [Acytostelium subglobosum LB1]